MATTNGQYITRDQVPEIARAVHDRVKSMVDARLANMPSETTVQVIAAAEELIAAKVAEAIAEVRKEFDKRLDAMEAKHDKLMGDIITAIKSMPVPTVTVSPAEVTVNVPKLDQPHVTVEAPTVNVAAPSVNVEGPKVTVESPTVNVAAPNVNVEAPNVTVEAAIVNVSPAEVKAPDVVVNVPKRSVKKHISYDQNGRPVTIEEREE